MARPKGIRMDGRRIRTKIKKIQEMYGFTLKEVKQYYHFFGKSANVLDKMIKEEEENNGN